MEEQRQQLLLDTGNRFQVFKVGERTFQIGDVNFEKNFIYSIIKLLDFGHKYIPNYYFSSFNIFKNIFTDLNDEILNFNSQLYFKDILIARNRDLTQTTSKSFSFLDFLRKPRYFNGGNNIPIVTETLEFQIELLNQLDNISLNNQSNISLSEFKSISRFQKLKPFKVVELDKNVGCAIISNELYDDLALEHLSDTNTYKKIDSNPLEEIIKELNNSLMNLLENKHINKELFNLLLVKQAKLGNFRLLPKVHKEKFGVRPIISYKNNPTNNLCKLLDRIIRPFVESSSSYIKDSQNFIQKNIGKKYPKNAKLFTFDVVSLYTNINHEKCLDTLSDFFKDKIDPEFGIDIIGFREILRLVLKNNYFTYETHFYYQCKGIAMGSIAGPSIANMFVYCLENIWIVNNLPLSYVRFIDDIHYIDFDDSKIESLRYAFGDLELNMTTGNSVDFLDVNTTIDKISGDLIFKPFFKKTNTFSYLLTSSNHPSFIFKNIPKSLFIRLRRICSNINDFCYFSLKIISHLLSRGYDLKTLLKSFNMVLDLDRMVLLEYKDKNNNERINNIIYFKHYFDFNILNFNSILKKAFSCFINKNERNNRFKDLKIKMINKMNYSIGALFIHNFKLKRTYKNFYKRCLDFKCKTCLYFSSDHYLNIKNNFILPVFDNSNCETENCVYIISCKLCKDAYYVGQTKCISIRNYHHIRDIIKFKKYLINMDKCVAKHFHLKNHNFMNDLVCFIIVKDIEPLEKRLSYESFFINLLKRFDVKLLNEKIPKLFT